VVIPLDLAILLDTLEQDVRADHVVHGKFVRVAKAQVHMRVGGEMEHGVDVVLLQAFDHVGSDGDIAVEEVEVARLLRLQQACIVERAAIVEFVEGHHDVVVSLVFNRQVAYKSRATVVIRAVSMEALFMLLSFSW
jgi:hypothetical protein